MKKNRKKFSERVVAWLRKDPAKNVRRILCIFAAGLFLIGFVLGCLVGRYGNNNSSRSRSLVASAESGAYDSNLQPSQIGFSFRGDSYIPLTTVRMYSQSDLLEVTLCCSYKTDLNTYTIGSSILLIGNYFLSPIFSGQFFAYHFDPRFEGYMTSSQLIGGVHIGDDLIFASLAAMFPVSDTVNYSLYGLVDKNTREATLNFYSATNVSAGSKGVFAVTEKSSVSTFYFSFPRSGQVTTVTSASSASVRTGTEYLFLSQPKNYGAVYTPTEYQQYGQQQFTSGKNVGYNEGYSKGLEVGGNNNFFSLMSAVVDAPITALTSALDVEVLGFNLKDVFLSLLTTALVIAAIKFFTSLGTN